MTFSQEFINYLLGDVSPALFAACLLLGYVGFVLSLFHNAMNRDPDSAGTPRDFKASFLVADNILRIIFNILLLPVAIRFSQEILGAQMNVYASLLLGIGLDRAAQAIFKNAKKRKKSKNESDEGED